MIYLQQEIGRAWVCLPLGISLGLSLALVGGIYQTVPLLHPTLSELGPFYTAGETYASDRINSLYLDAFYFSDTDVETERDLFEMDFFELTCINSWIGKY